jgi:septal ring factor EnvC (AmiA/AmiB activator)
MVKAHVPALLLAAFPVLVLAKLEPIAVPLDQIQQHIASTQKSREALQAVRDRLESQLADIERRQAELARIIHDIELQSQVRERRIAGLREQRTKQQAELKQQQHRLDAQLRSAHAVGGKDWLKLLLNQEDPSRLARVLAYYGYLNQARADLIRRCQDELTRLGDTEAELNGEMALQAEARQHSLKERTALQEANKARRLLLESWARELQSQDARLAQLREDERRLTELVQTMGHDSESADTFPTGPVVALPLPAVKKGPCPPPGAVLAGFGSPRMSGRWDGILIGGKEGAPVGAVAAGRVVFADWFRGYGLLLILDHGDGVMSLYAFNQTLYKSKGDGVSAGEIIAALGASGGRDKPGLYFGIRERGQPVDPVGWCARRA